MDEVAWCSALFALIAKSSWIRARLFTNPDSIKSAVAAVCDFSMNTFNECLVTAAATMDLLGSMFEGSSDAQWAQTLVRSGAHRAAQAHIIAYVATFHQCYYDTASAMYSVIVGTGTETIRLLSGLSVACVPSCASTQLAPLCCAIWT